MGGQYWQVPEALRERMQTDKDTRRWVASVPEAAAELADLWSLRPDGAVLSGFLSTVWPVRDEHGRALMLKIGYPDHATPGEVLALRAWDGRGAVRCWKHNPERNALLLQRLDARTDLHQHPDADEACALAARVLADLHDGPTLPVMGVRSMGDDADRMAEGIVARADRTSALLPEGAVSAALSTLREMSSQPWGPDHGQVLHNDCHYLNVLHTLPEDDEQGWRAIDPLPVIGPVEAEAVPLLRNRWSDAAATGEPERTLRYRLDQVMDAVGGDVDLGRRWAQAVAVDNLSWLLPQAPDHMFVPPYTVMASW